VMKTFKEEKELEKDSGSSGRDVIRGTGPL
jgi:hypothetical protein